MACKECKKKYKKDLDLSLLTLDELDEIKVQIKEYSIRNFTHTNKVSGMKDYYTQFNITVRNHHKLADFINHNKFQFVINGVKQINNVYELKKNKLKIKVTYD